MHLSPFSIAIDASAGWRSIKVPGRNTVIEQTYEPVAPNGLYRTPQAANAISLRIRAGGNAADSAAGTGAREIELYGLDAQGYEVTERIAMAGAAQSAATQTKFMRLFRAQVTQSGTYATQTAGSHAANILIEDTTGKLWTTIPLNGFAESITRIGAFTVPVNYEAYLIGFRINAQAQKLVDAVVFTRENVLQAAAPYAPMVAQIEIFNISGFIDLGYDAPIYVPPMTDIGVMAVVDVQSAQVNSELGLLLRRVQ